MLRHTTLNLVEFVSCFTMCSIVRVAIGATAIAMVSVTVISPVVSPQSLMSVHPRQLDITGKTGEELSIINQSTEWRDIRIELTPSSGSVTECSLRYSPKSASVPPGGIQVVRLLLHGASPQLCRTDRTLIVSDQKTPNQPLFEIPIRVNQSFEVYGQSEFFFGAP